MPRLILYGTAGCHLCEEAAALLREALARTPGTLEWNTVDIADSPELLARYAVRIPVLHCRNSGEELAWPFDDAGIGEFIESIRPLSS